MRSHRRLLVSALALVALFAGACGGMGMGANGSGLIAAWARDRPAFPNYAAGTWGPQGADELLHKDGRSWRRH